MAIAAVTEFVLGVDAEPQPLEEVAEPLSAQGASRAGARIGAPRPRMTRARRVRRVAVRTYAAADSGT
jgi:hypothetical protein